MTFRGNHPRAGDGLLRQSP